MKRDPMSAAACKSAETTLACSRLVRLSGNALFVLIQSIQQWLPDKLGAAKGNLGHNHTLRVARPEQPDAFDNRAHA